MFFSVDNGTGDIFRLGKTIPYSEEYKQQPVDIKRLEHMAHETSGQVLTAPKQAFRKLAQKSEATQRITVPLVVVAMLLFFMDITLRRFTGVIRRKSKPKQQPTTTIMDKLKQ